MIPTLFFDIIDRMTKEKETKTEISANFKNENKGLVSEIIKTIGILLLATVFFRFYLLQPFLVNGISMEPNFHDGQYLVVSEISYLLGSPKRGDAVVFKHPEPACNDFIDNNYLNRVFISNIMPNPPCTNYIKRVIGLPGETVVIRDGKVYIRNSQNPDGFKLEESYTVPGLETFGNQTRTLGQKEYFVLGDNREANASSDSREWGVLPKNHIIGKAWLILYPLNQAEVVNRPEY